MPDGKHLGILQSIESAVVRFHKQEPAVIDMDVLDALNALVRRYGAEEDGRSAPNPRLAERPARVFAALLETCEEILGRASGSKDNCDAPPSLKDLIECLRRLQSSVRLWNQEGGRRGYLEYIGNYVA